MFYSLKDQSVKTNIQKILNQESEEIVKITEKVADFNKKMRKHLPKTNLGLRAHVL